MDAETKSQLLNQKIGEDGIASESGQLSLWEGIPGVKDRLEVMATHSQALEEQVALQEGSAASITWKIEQISDNFDELKGLLGMVA